jgi:hypothetical protein
MSVEVGDNSAMSLSRPGGKIPAGTAGPQSMGGMGLWENLIVSLMTA